MKKKKLVFKISKKKKKERKHVPIQHIPDDPNDNRRKVGIIGASGYTGIELIKILSKHKGVRLVVLNSRSCNGKKVSDLFPDVQCDLRFTNYSFQEINGFKLDALFLCTPNGVSMQNVPQFHCKIIDLSADYRFEDPLEYERIYGIKHIDNKRKAVYGLPELFREQIKKADLIANPGCYVTASILATLPIQKYADYIVFDCKSGFSGAGKEPSYVNDPKNYTGNVIPYKLTKHRHKYEIQQFIKTKLSFTPQVVPFFRGMLCIAHVLLKKGMSPEKARELYKHFYRNHPFVKIVDKIPEIKDTQNNNYCLIGGFEIDENNQLVVVSTIDNLLKGASGQAVQNMNLMLGFKEDEGLRTP